MRSRNDSLSIKKWLFLSEHFIDTKAPYKRLVKMELKILDL